MKKILLASTMLIGAAGMAAADVSISGYGRFGMDYSSARNMTWQNGVPGYFTWPFIWHPATPGSSVVDPNAQKTVFNSRLRMTIAGTMETDGGVTFGGKLRVQYDQGMTSSTFNAAQYWIAYEGLTVQFGNVDTAFDSVALNYNSEMGFQDSSPGDTVDWDFFAYNSKGQDRGYTGVAAFYSISDVNLYLSYVNPDQYVKNLGVFGGAGNPYTEQKGPWYAGRAISEEIGIAADYTFNQFTIAAAYTANAGGIKNHNIAFLGAAYNFGDGNVGLNYYNYDYPNYTATPDNTGTPFNPRGTHGLSASPKDEHQVTLYGNYTFGATTVRAVVTDYSAAGSKTGYGIGADYDLGNGARISGTYQRQVDGTKTADLGVRFDF